MKFRFTHLTTRRSKNNNYGKYYFYNYLIGLGFQEFEGNKKSWRTRSLGEQEV